MLIETDREYYYYYLESKNITKKKNKFTMYFSKL
jgi:hypothetical protein